MEITGKNKEQESSSSSDSNNNKKKQEHQKVAFYKLFSFADSWDLVLMIVGTISAIANGVAQPLLALFIGQVINEFGTSDPKHVVHHVSTVSLKFLYLAMYSGIACFLQITCWVVTGERQSARIRGLYLKTLLRQDIAFFDMETTTGEVINRMSGDTALIQDAIGEKVGNFIQIIATFVGGFAIAFIRGWLLACVLLSSIPCLVFVGAIMAVLMTKTSSQAHQAYTDAGNIVEQTVGAIRTVASFTGEKDAAKKYNSKILIAYKATVKQGLVSGLGLGAFLFVMLSTYALAVWYGAKLIIDKDYNGGQVLNVIMVMMIGGMSLGQSSPYLNAFSAGQAAAYKMFEAIQRTPKIDASTTEGTILEDIKGEIELKDVNFRYPARPDVQIFSNFSLYIASGSTVALVGESGSGKSTIVSLIERFYDPDSGEVLIDGVNLKQLQLAWIRQKIGLVSQEPVLFTTTLKENITYGKVDATDDEIRTAIQLANAAKFIDKLPKGLNTLVGERGTQLSGGQKQRIAIARAILKNPRVLLLDEATSALDAESEHIVQDALDRIMTNRTTLIIAHRLTTIKNVDMIAVVHQGKIIERGSHKDLIEDPDGSYSQLVKLQEGTKEKETSSEYATSLDMMPNHNRSLSTSSNQRYSMRKTRGSSSGRNSISVNFSMPGHINFQETVGGYPSHDSDDTISKSEVAYEKVIREKSKIVPLKRLVSMNKQEVPILVLGTIAAAIQGTIFPLFGYLISSVIKVFYEPTALLRRDSRKWALIYLSLGFVSFLTIPIQNFLFAIAGGKLIQRIRKLTFEKVIHQEVKYFDDPANSSGAIGARLATDAVNLKSLVGDRLGLIMQNIATLCIGLLIAFTANWMLALIVLAVGPLMFAQGYLQGKVMDGFSGDAMLKYEEASQVANDAVGSIRTVASFCAEKKVIDLYEMKCEGPVKAGIRLGLISGLGFGFSFFILFCTNAFCFYIGAVLIHHGKATFAEVFKVFLALVFTAATLSQSSSMAMDMNKAKESAVSIFKILDSKPKINASTNEGITQESITGEIEFSHVSFRYPTRPDIQIFKDFSLCIPSSKTVALVGESGSGKSTIISMIERFYEPDEGEIFLDGVELHKFKLRWLRQQIGLVSQEPVLFNETIRANIAYGMQQGTETEHEIIKAAKAANAHNFISSLPQGYETLVGERGIQLSGGQKQRIAIARAVLKNPKILLLDEATSALDVESESIVQNALDNVMVGRTTVVVAHRLGTIRNVDIIAVIKNGAVIEKGNHNELMQIPQGAYASLVSLHANVASSS